MCIIASHKYALIRVVHGLLHFCDTQMCVGPCRPRIIALLRHICVANVHKMHAHTCTHIYLSAHTILAAQRDTYYSVLEMCIVRIRLYIHTYRSQQTI